MKNTLQLLHQITEKELLPPIHCETEEKLNTFIKQCEKDYVILFAGHRYDPNAAAETLLNALHRIANETGYTYFSDQAQRIETMYDVLPKPIAIGILGQFLADLCMALNTVAETEYVIDYFMRNILADLTAHNNQMALQSLLNFGTFLEETYPGQPIVAIQLELTERFTQDLQQHDIPDLTSLGEIYQASLRSLAEEADATHDKPNKSIALLKGIRAFVALFGHERLQPNLQRLVPSLSEVEATSHYLGQTWTRQDYRAHSIQEQLQRTHRTYSEVLMAEIRDKISQCPESYLAPFNDALEANNLEPIIQHIAKHKEPTFPWLAERVLSAKLIFKTKHFLTLRALFDNIKETALPYHNLQRFKEVFAQEETQNALHSYSDRAMILFIKEVTKIVQSFSPSEQPAGSAASENNFYSKGLAYSLYLLGFSKEKPSSAQDNAKENSNPQPKP